MTEKNGVYFQELTQEEKASKLSLLSRNHGEVIIWEKGSKIREKISAQEFNKTSSRLLCKSLSQSKYVGKKVLFSFELKGLSFFGSGEFRPVNQYSNSLECSEKVFKSERRSTFRLLTFPHHKVFLHMPLEQEEVSESNVIGMKVGMSETGLFKKFLTLVEEKEAGTIEGLAPFRVLDLSVTGAAYQVGELEAEFFKKEAKFKDLVLDFNGEQIKIPAGEVVYNVEMLSGQKRHKTFKVGVRFKDIDTNLDQSLGRLINGALRDFETEFEEFIK